MGFLQPKTQAPDLGGIVGGLTPEDGSANPYSNAMQGASPVSPRPRRSFLETVGQIGDVLAKAGGLPALYQPTVDARQDRELQLADHARAVDLDKLKLQSNQMDNTTQANKIVGQALKGVAAVRAANPNADTTHLWQNIAQTLGVDPQHIEAIGNTLANDPNGLAALTESLDENSGKDKYSGNIIYAQNPATGELRAYQAGTGGGADARQVKLDSGFSPVDPLKFVDAGGTMVGVGERSGRPTRIIPKTEAPGKAADRQSRETIASNNNRTQVQIAGMPARAKAAAAGDAPGTSTALAYLDNIERGFGDLHNMKALPGDNGGTVSNVMQAIGRTGVGQALGEQAGTPSAQKRLELTKNINQLQQTLIKSLPGSATRTKFEQEIVRKSLPDPATMSYSTARTVIKQLRDEYQRALKPGYAADSGTPAPARRITPKAPAAGNSGGWKVIGVN